MPNSLPYPGAPAGAESRSVLSIPAFRKLWNSMAFSSFGDWLGNGNISNQKKVFWDFDEARIFVHKLNLNNQNN
jgi:hypothetical protein